MKKLEKKQDSGLKILEKKYLKIHVRYEKYATMFPDIVTCGFFKVLFIRFAGIITSI